MVMTVDAGIFSAPLPPMMPPVQVIALAVRLIGEVPLSGRPCMERVGIDCAAALFIVSVPPMTASGLAIVPAKVLVPLCHCTDPAPVKLEAASNVRVSLVLKLRMAPEAILNVAPLLVTPAR